MRAQICRERGSGGQDSPHLQSLHTQLSWLRAQVSDLYNGHNFIRRITLYMFFYVSPYISINTVVLYSILSLKYFAL